MDKKIILKQARAVYTKISQVGGLHIPTVLNVLKLEFQQQTKNNQAIEINQDDINKLIESRNVWDNIAYELIQIYGYFAYKHWFSKLNAKIDESNKMLRLISPDSFINDDINESRKTMFETRLFF